MRAEKFIAIHANSVHPQVDAPTIGQLWRQCCSLLHYGIHLFFGIADNDLNSPIGLAASGRIIGGHRPDLAKAANVIFVAGRQTPNGADARSSAADSVQSVIDGAMNILFVSEGFKGSSAATSTTMFGR